MILQNTFLNLLFRFQKKQFFDFKKSAQKEVNYLVKEFEMKKSASAYARAAHQGQEFLIQLNFTHTSIMRIYLRKSQFFQMVRITD